MTFHLDLINILILVVILFNSTLGFFVFLSNRKEKINRSFFVFSIAATAWGVSMFLYRGTRVEDLSVLFSRILYVSAASIPYIFLFFIRVFPEEKFWFTRKFDWLLTLPFLGMVFISLVPNLLISGVSMPPTGEKIILFSRLYHTIYALYIMLYFSFCYFLLIIKYYQLTDVKRIQMAYVIAGTFISTIIGVATNLIMPYLGDFSLNWMGQIGIIAMVGAISYSILHHKLFQMKVLATQFIVFILCTSLFTRLMFSSSRTDLIINATFLVIIVIVSIFLIRSVISEVEQREKIQKLAEDLSKANERLKDLDKLKSEFLSLATHQIRAPLAAIKGYASMIIDGDYGYISASAKGAVKVIFQSCQNLVVIVNDFLDISRIEQGRMKYDVTEFDFKKLVEDSVTELKPTLENAGLQISFTTDDAPAYPVRADQGKMKQVIGNIIDNSIKYTPKGEIKLSLAVREDKVRLSVADTGIGIAPEDIPKLFGKFIRAKEASKTNVIGTGLGLYVARSMVTAQGGEIWVESAGLGKGSTFIIELPMMRSNES